MPAMPLSLTAARSAAVLPARHQAGSAGEPCRAGQGMGPHSGVGAAGQEDITGEYIWFSALPELWHRLQAGRCLGRLTQCSVRRGP